MLKEMKLIDILGNDIIFEQIDECKKKFNSAIEKGDMFAAKRYYGLLEIHYKHIGLIITDALKHDYIKEILTMEV